jgi:hypothetical protein
VTLLEQLEQIWEGLLEFMTQFIIPDWNAVIGLLPILVFLGIVGPLLSIVPLVMVIYLVRKPRVSTKVVEGPQLAAIGAGGEPIFPPGLPYCRRDDLIYASGTQRCDRCGDDLSVICPMCSLGRTAMVDTCTNCGLVLKVKPQAVVVRSSSGPRPGGAAVA